jgi:protein gp37
VAENSGKGEITMGTKTAAETVDHTQNFWVGCHKVSEGCDHCYARVATEKRGLDFSVVRQTETWKDPLKWQREGFKLSHVRKVFSCSYGDFFHPHADQWRPGAWQIIRDTPNLIWSLLTKRAELIAGRLPEDWGSGYRNVWLGVSVEMKKYAGRMDLLREIPAVVRYVMCEPLLEDLTPEIDEHLEGFHWLLAGGESGNGTTNYRPMDLQWARKLRDVCAAKAIPFYFKQPAGRWPYSKQRPKARLDGVVHDAYPAALETYGPPSRQVQVFTEEDVT